MSGALGPSTWSPERMTRSGFSSSKMLSMKLRVRGSASQLMLGWLLTPIASLHCPMPVARWGVGDLQDFEAAVFAYAWVWLFLWAGFGLPVSDGQSGLLRTRVELDRRT